MEAGARGVGAPRERARGRGGPHRVAGLEPAAPTSPGATAGSSARSSSGSEQRGPELGAVARHLRTAGSSGSRSGASIEHAGRLAPAARSPSSRGSGRASRRCSSLSTGSNGCCTEPELRPDAAAATSSRSYSSTRTPASARKAAAAQPTMPPPMIATSAGALTSRSRSRRSTCRSATPPAPCRRCRRRRPRAAARVAARRRRARSGRSAAGSVRDGRAAAARAESGDALATSSVLVSSIGSRITCGNTSPMVADEHLLEVVLALRDGRRSRSRTPSGREPVADALEELAVVR